MGLENGGNGRDRNETVELCESGNCSSVYLCILDSGFPSNVLPTCLLIHNKIKIKKNAEIVLAV